MTRRKRLVSESFRNLCGALRSFRKLPWLSAAQVAAVLVVATSAPLLAESKGAEPRTAAPSPVRVAQEIGQAKPVQPLAKRIVMEPNDSIILYGEKITTTSVNNPDVVKLVPISGSEVLANAGNPGKAVVRVWDKNGLATYEFTVTRKLPSANEVATAISQQLGVTVKPTVTGETLVLTGMVPSPDIAQKAGSIAETFGWKVLNLLTVEPVSSEKVVAALKAALKDEPVQFEVLADQTIIIRGAVPAEGDAYRIQQLVQAWIGTVESSSQSEKSSLSSFTGAGLTSQQERSSSVVDKARTEARQPEPGVAEVAEEFNITRHVFGGRIAGGPRIVVNLEVNPALARQLLVSAQVIEIDRTKLKQLGIQWAEVFGENATNPIVITETRTPPTALDNIGPFKRATNLSATIRALIDESAARILSEPKVLIADGHSANIVVGGELPIPIAQSGAIGVNPTITVEFKPFGIQLTVRPKIAPDNRILLTLTPEVSKVDADISKAVSTGVVTIPALKTTRATTTVHVADGQSLAIGGLLSSEDVKVVQRVPLLSKIPVIGELFKSRRFQRNETELVIIVTPTIVERGSTVPINVPK